MLCDALRHSKDKLIPKSLVIQIPTRPVTQANNYESVNGAFETSKKEDGRREEAVRGRTFKVTEAPLAASREGFYHVDSNGSLIKSLKRSGRSVSLSTCVCGVPLML